MSGRVDGNIVVRLEQFAENRPEQDAVIADGVGRQTFRGLRAQCHRYANALRCAGVERGSRVVVLVRPGLDFAGVIFAVLRLGGLPVLIDAGMGLRGFLRCVAQVRPEVMIGIPSGHLLRRCFPRAFRSVRRAFVVGGAWPTASALEPLARDQPSEWQGPAVADDDPAAILFTSGSTGPAKGVLYEHGMFHAQVQAIQSHFGLEPGEIELATFPLFALFCPLMGMTCVLPRMDFSRPGRASPQRLLAAVQIYGTTNAFGSPALWRRLSAYCCGRGLLLSPLRRALIAGAPVDWRIVQQLKRCLPSGAEVFTPYGATESLPVSAISGTEILKDCLPATRSGAGICIGLPLPGRCVRIIPATDQPLNEWCASRCVGPQVKGEIVVCGEMVTREYVDLPRATALAKIPDGARVWHRTGDIGYFDDGGRLWYCGRKGHRVQTVAGTLYPECCEAVFNDHPAVQRSALVGVGPAGQQRPVIIIEPLPKRFPRRSRRAVLAAEILAAGRGHAVTRDIDTLLFRRTFPVDVRHNAKINREQLARWAAGRIP